VFDVWLSPLTIRSADADRVVLVAPDETANWVQQRFGALLGQAAAGAVGSSADVAVCIVGADQPVPEPDSSIAPHQTKRVRPLHPKYTFDQFVIGTANRFAHAAALSAAELPGSTYNPLFLVGPPGVGKTHLLHSIGNYVQAFGSGLTVRYTTAEDFTNHFRSALEQRAIDPFKQHYRHVDVLLIDDVQFLAHKVRTEEEFFHTFNALRESGSQIVLTADRHPSEMHGLEERLCQRFESGLLVEIERPDLSMRRTIVRKRAQIDGLQLPDDVSELIAERVTDTVRAIEAALIRIAAYASLTGEQITTETADRVLSQLYGRERARAKSTVSIEQIQQLVAESFSLTTEELESPSRAARVSWPRQLAMYLAREHTSQSLPAIGRAFGGRDHTTVMHACKRTAERITNDPAAAQTADELIAKLRSGVARSDRVK
jgi:chromosomal replication initiator protein